MTATVTATATEAGTETGTITGGLWWSTMRETQWSLSKTKSIFGGYCGFLSLFSVINCCGFVIPPQGYRSFSTTCCGCIFITAGSKRRGEGEHCVVNSIAPVPIAFDRQRDRARDSPQDGGQRSNEYDLSVSVHITGIPQADPSVINQQGADTIQIDLHLVHIIYGMVYLIRPVGRRR